MYNIIDYECFKVGEVSTFSSDEDVHLLMKEAIGLVHAKYAFKWAYEERIRILFEKDEENEISVIRKEVEEWLDYYPGCKPTLSFVIKR